MPEREGAVRAFREAALAAGGNDNGGPGPRPEYSPRYFGAFVLDPDGHNMEAVFHADEPYGNQAFLRGRASQYASRTA